ncbi:MAG: SLBB domain-containing protein, partial [Actinobacteria bacterium]|nr:SLBB domain-containing protein [Actinomycetota bacterium]
MSHAGESKERVVEERVDRYRGLLTIVLLALVAGGAVAWLLRRPEARPLEIVQPPQPTKAPERVGKVYISGEVLNPGVYAVREGDRVEDALRAAGGVTDEA